MVSPLLAIRCRADLLQGVVDVANYYSTLWSNNLMDTDKGLMLFYESCVQAGPSACPIYEPTAEAVASRVDRLMEKIKKQPMGISDKGEYGILTYAAMRATLFLGLYKPYALLPTFAKLFADIERGDGSSLLRFYSQLQEKLQCDCPSTPPGLPYKPREEAGMAVACTDGDPVNDTLSEMREYFERLAETSSFGELWTIRLNCLWVFKRCVPLPRANLDIGPGITRSRRSGDLTVRVYP